MPWGMWVWVSCAVHKCKPNPETNPVYGYGGPWGLDIETHEERRCEMAHNGEMAHQTTHGG